MLKRIIGSFVKLLKSNEMSFKEKLESFNAPLVHKTEWHSISRIRIGYKNRIIRLNKRGSISFKPTVQAMLFPLPFIGLGIYVMSAFSVLNLPWESILIHPISTFLLYFQTLPLLFSKTIFWGHLFGFVFFLLGLYSLYLTFLPINFDLTNRNYTKGFFNRHVTSFNDIHAIQLISDAGNDPDDSVLYEMNLVLENCERLFVFGSTDENLIRADSMQVAKLISVPVWDAI